MKYLIFILIYLSLITIVEAKTILNKKYGNNITLEIVCLDSKLFAIAYSKSGGNGVRGITMEQIYTSVNYSKIPQPMICK